MDDRPVLPVTPSQVGAFGLFLAGVVVFAFGLYAVGPGHVYSGDTWPDYLTMLAASLLIVRAVVDASARDREGAWSWRTLRPRAFIGCAIAFAFLIVMSASVPIETGVWAVGDSAQGFSMFVFAESVVIAITAAVKAPGRPGVTSLFEHPRAGVMPQPGAARIALRRWRLFSRDTYVDVDRTGVVIVVPRVFGRRTWFVPMGTVGVLLESYVPVAGPHDDEEWVTRDDFRTPYLCTTSTWTSPNLVLLFTVPQPIPPIRWTAELDDISASATRRADPLMVDGLGLRAVDPDAAREVLVTNGAQAIADPDAFVQRHRDIVRDPEQVRAVVVRRRRKEADPLTAAGRAAAATTDRVRRSPGRPT